MQVLALVPNLLGHAPGQRSSIEIWDNCLRDRGIYINYYPFETQELHNVLYSRGNTPQKSKAMVGAYARYIRDFPDLDEFDLVYVYREASLIGPEIIERYLKAKRIPYVYSLDDPIFVPFRSPFQGWFSHLKFPGKVKRTCAGSAAVLANSYPLQAWARQFARKVVRTPSSIKPMPTPKEFERTSEPVVVGWMGSASTGSNLRLIGDALGEVQRKTGAVFEFVGSGDIHIDNLEYSISSWSLEREQSALVQFDIGLAPMPDNPWNHWKFSLKVAQYMGAGIPVVATPMGDIPNQVREGVTGYLAKDLSDWQDHLVDLVLYQEQREAMSNMSWTVATQEYSASHVAKNVAKVFESAANRE